MNSKLEKTIFSYLNDKNYHIIAGNSDIVFGKRLDYITDIYFVENVSDEHSIIRITLDEDNICYIYAKLVVEIENFFSLGIDESKYIIKKWIDDIVNVSSHDVFYGVNDFLEIPYNFQVLSIPLKLPIERPIQTIDSMTMRIIKTKIDFQ